MCFIFDLSGSLEANRVRIILHVHAQHCFISLFSPSHLTLSSHPLISPSFDSRFMNNAHYEQLMKSNALDGDLARRIDAYRVVAAAP